ncbi:death-on-curing protein [Kitasatospora sp. SolWspMP-SS2h]|uniref:type II toxin-antitoxin system death-on-curing family toxin n=1 Tax=Kitasatospora sp. SolWspMP-SS2h TaxID=1305729 RepID=UPI000DBF6571|nr:Fic family protein [Kitasatospora sp. SolWspMP-SS2h]RAJ47018.1 death-on-curing protein [Kitasatospora sp. SolWspMP-SS2h]
MNAPHRHTTDHLDEDDMAYLLGDVAVVRERSLLRSALGRPQSSAFGADAYPDVWTKAVALGESLARNHPMTDRNKRTAFESMLLFLDYNGQPYTDPRPDDAVLFMLRLAQGGYRDRFATAVADFRRILGAAPDPPPPRRPPAAPARIGRSTTS